MDAEQKKLIEEALKSDYFDRSLDIQIQKKAFEILKRYKWIGAVLALFIFAVNAYLGFELKDFYSSKLELQRSAKDLTLESSYLQRLNELGTREAQLRDQRDTEMSQLNERSFRIHEKQYESLTKDAEYTVNQGAALVEEMKMIRESFNVRFKSLNTEIGANIAELNEERGKWEKKTWEIIRNSSTVFAYIERGGEAGDWDYHPKTFTLPYSSDKIKLIFKEFDEKDSTEANGEKREYKEAMIIMQVTDSGGEEIFNGALYLKEHGPENIPNTEHQITLQYAYTPPNIHGLAWPFIGIIPDFAVLAISLKNPDTFLNAPDESTAIDY